jgi:hypothetical protein
VTTNVSRVEDDWLASGWSTGTQPSPTHTKKFAGGGVAHCPCGGPENKTSSRYEPGGAAVASVPVMVSPVGATITLSRRMAPIVAVAVPLPKLRPRTVRALPTNEASMMTGAAACAAAARTERRLIEAAATPTHAKRAASHSIRCRCGTGISRSTTASGSSALWTTAVSMVISYFRNSHA